MEAVIVAIVTGGFSLITFLLTRFFTVRDEKKKKEADENDKYTKLTEKEEKCDETIRELQGGIKDISTQIENMNSTLSLFSETLKDVLRNDIISMYNRCVERGYMPVYERENLDHMSKEYYGLKGNGVIPGLVEKMYELPTEPQENDWNI